MNCTVCILQWLTWWRSRGKYKAGEYLKTTGLPYTIVYNSFYYENLANSAFNMLRKGENGTLTVNFGTPAHVHLPSYSVEETGGWVLQVFKRPLEYLGMFILQNIADYLSSNVVAISAGKDDVHFIGENLTAVRYAELISKAVGVPVIPNVLSDEEFHSQANSENPYVKEIYLNMKYVWKNSRCMRG